MIKAIIAPVVGGVIGYITNDLAIRMLFRPRTAIYIGKFHVPFTPGLIPSQKGRIAASIGNVISQQLLNEETLRQTLLSDKAIQTLQEKVRQTMLELSLDQRTIKEILGAHTDPQTLEEKTLELEQKATELICQRIDEAQVGYAIVDNLTGNISDLIAQNKLLAMLMDNAAQKTVRQKIAEKVNEIVHEKAPGAVHDIVEKYRVDLMRMRVCDIYDRFSDRKEEFMERGTQLYISILGQNLDKLLRAINIEKIVVDKINAFDAAELEAMIFGIMKKELNAIVYLGAALGFLMGFINLLF